MTSIQPRKQRKALADAPKHVRRKQIASHLSEELLLKYNRRSVPVIVGDEVKLLRGGRKGKSGKVIAVDTKARKVTIDGINHKKADGTEVPVPVDPSNLLVTRLNLEDKRRRSKLGEDEKAVKAAKPAKTEKPAKAKKTAAPAAAEEPASPAETEATAKPATKAETEATAKPAAKAETTKTKEATQ